MKQTVREIMTKNPVALPADTPLEAVARTMRDQDIGAVVVLEGGQICGVATDRDVVVRGLARSMGPEAKLREVCSSDLVALQPDAPVEEAVDVMRSKSIRRLPVVEDGRPVGIVSLGDLAVERDPGSALAGISSAAPNR